MLFSADYLFPVSSPPVKNGIVEVSEDGVILGVYSPQDFAGNTSEIKYHPGIICPGFVNVHCHLELSHLKGKFEERTGLDEFIRQVEQYRAAYPEEITLAMENAEREMIGNGIAAVGDISNTSHSFPQKSKGQLYYHTFIELLGFHPDKADRAFEAGLALYDQLGGKGSLTLHAPYSASKKLLEKISAWSVKHHGLLSMHNQENADEDLLFMRKKGKILQRLQHFGIDTSFFEATGKSSLRSVLATLPVQVRLLLVHNTFTSREDIQWALQHSSNLYWCFCPNANLYIEGKLPDLPLFVENECRICLGTDSLASNHRLSILSEMQSIQERFAFPLQTLLGWATLNGAAFLGIDDVFGSLEKGKRPGLNLLTNCDGENLSADTAVTKLI